MKEKEATHAEHPMLQIMTERVYVTHDGERFENEGDAVRHARVLKIESVFESYMRENNIEEFWNLRIIAEIIHDNKTTILEVLK